MLYMYFMVVAFVGLIILSIIMVVMIPFVNILLPSIFSSMGATVALMVEFCVIAILFAGIFVFIRDMIMTRQENVQKEV